MSTTAKEVSPYVTGLKDSLFSVKDEYEKREGVWLLKFERSHFLDLSDSMIVNVNLFKNSGKATHYGVYTWDYIIDVLTCNDPTITQE